MRALREPAEIDAWRRKTLEKRISRRAGTSPDTVSVNRAKYFSKQFRAVRPTNSSTRRFSRICPSKRPFCEGISA